jgi:endonuclease/exonuclease/phosphatase family metal-dependent hydrolase
VPRLRILTLNIWNRQGPWRKRLCLIQRELQSLDPDLVGLQEVMRHQPGSIDQASEIAAGLGYHVAYGAASRSSGGGEFGNAVLSKYPILVVENVSLPGEPSEEARSLLHVEVDAPVGRVPFFTTHFAWKPEHSQVRLRQAVAVVDAIDAATVPGGFPALLVGDFNADPDAEEMRVIREGRSTAGRGAPFIDCFGAAGDGSPGHTFASSNRYAANGCEKNQRIDYIFTRGVARGARGDVVLARVACLTPQGRVFASDHYGVYAEIEG